MFNVCPGCGEYAVEKAIDPSGPFAICPKCGHRHPFQQLPLFVVTGASGSGKTTVALRLVACLPECIVMESDILWRDEFNAPDDNYRAYRDLWLRMAKNIGQSGRPVVLCGTFLPDQLERSPERRYFTEVYYLALTCDTEILASRLRNRPSWRQSGHDEFVERMLTFNRWLQDHASTTQPPMTLLNTSNLTLAATIDQTTSWVRTPNPETACHRIPHQHVREENHERSSQPRRKTRPILRPLCAADHCHLQRSRRHGRQNTGRVRLA